jgi:hypothetical protein
VDLRQEADVTTRAPPQMLQKLAGTGVWLEGGLHWRGYVARLGERDTCIVPMGKQFRRRHT